MSEYTPTTEEALRERLEALEMPLPNGHQFLRLGKSGADILLPLFAEIRTAALLPRTVTTVEELDELPNGSVLEDSEGGLWRKLMGVFDYGNDIEEDGKHSGAIASYAPFRILHVGGETR